MTLWLSGKQAFAIVELPISFSCSFKIMHEEKKQVACQTVNEKE
jgi:hypothetical protein